MKKTKICHTCKGTGEKRIVIYGFFRNKIDFKICSDCNGEGSYNYNEYVCSHCNYSHRMFIFDHFTGQCRKCYADVETGKYIDNFFYITEHSLPEISKKVNILLKEGYIPVGRPVDFPEYWISQAVIRKELK